MTAYYLIRAYGIRGGISHQSLAELVELNEKNLRKYLKELMNTILTSIPFVVAFNTNRHNLFFQISYRESK
ncbi:MAG: hypothetical protein ACRD8W_01310 [Nitrososphaeraceae archaeon]